MQQINEADLDLLEVTPWLWGNFEQVFVGIFPETLLLIEMT